jgi:MFS family permease
MMPATYRTCSTVVAGICFTIQALEVGTYIAFGVFFTPLMESFGGSRDAIAGASSTAFFSMGLFGILAGRLNNRFGPRPIMTVTALGLGCLLMGRLTSLWERYLYYGLVFGIASHGTLFGIAVFFGTAGGSVGPLLAGHLFDLSGSYRSTFWIITVMALIAWTWIGVLKPVRGR